MGIATYLLIGNLKCLINQLRQKDNKLNFLLAIFWLFLPNILALSVQIVFGISIASNKYLIWGLPGIALFGSLAYPNTFQLRGRITALFCAIIYSVLSNLYGFSPESWRTQAEWITTKKKENVGCVLVYSGLVESYGNSFHSSSELSEYLVSPIRYYLPNDTLLPLPLIGWDAQTLDFTKNFKSKAKSCSKQIFVAIGGTPAITNSSGQKVEIFEVISSALDTHGFKVNSSAENTERDRTIEFISSGREN